MKVIAPDKFFNGTIAGVQFVNGEAETENLRLLQWAKEKGYQVIDQEALPEPTAVDNASGGVVALDEITKAEIADLLTDRGIKYNKKDNKQELYNLMLGSD